MPILIFNIRRRQMAEIESTIGKKNVSSPARKVYTVSDEDFDDVPQVPTQETRISPEQFKAMQGARDASKVAQKTVSPEMKQKINVLTGIGRLEKEVTIDGIKFTLRSLKSKEMRDIVSAVAQTEVAAEGGYEMRARILSNSISMIDGYPVKMVLDAEKIASVYDFINESEESTVVALYNAYTEMTDKIDKTMVVKTEQDATEVAKEVKK